MHSPNAFAYIALLLWAPVSVAAFTVLRPPVACAVLVLGATMFLPVGTGFDLRGMPALGKEELASLFILVGGVVRCRRRLLTARPGRGLEVLVFLLMLGAIGTVLTNRDVLTYGSTRLSSLAPYDAVSMAVRNLLRYGVPFFLGRAFFRNSRDLRDLVLLIVAAGVVYSLLIIVELFLSPQLHRWTYGYFQRPFAGTQRYGGYRPMVFMANGLALALFMATAATMSAALARFTRLRRRGGIILGIPYGVVTFYLTAILVLCKSFASITYGIVGIALIALPRISARRGAALAPLVNPRNLTRAAAVLAILVTAYPLLRAAEVFPVGPILSVVKAVDEKRWDSLEFRFRNEDVLIAKARERSVFGWGGYRRSRVFDERGIDQTITDGYWIIILGKRGVVGFLCTFGLLVIPVIVAQRRIPKIPETGDRVLVAGLSLVLAIHALDLIPNGLFSFLPFFFAGALMGVLPGMTAVSPRSHARAPHRRSLEGTATTG